MLSMDDNDSKRFMRLRYVGKATEIRLAMHRWAQRFEGRATAATTERKMLDLMRKQGVCLAVRDQMDEVITQLWEIDV